MPIYWCESELSQQTGSDPIRGRKKHFARFTKLTTAPSYIIIFNILFPFSIDVCGHTLTISLKNLDWRATLEKELELCSAKTIPLCQSSTKDLQNLSRETKRQNLSQLSQLSFEELGGKKRYIHVFQSNLSKSNV